MRMPRIEKWELILGAALILLSAGLYGAHYLLFRDAHHIAIYLLGDLAFLPIEVLLVAVIVHRLLTGQEKKSMLSKLNMVIGAFFSEVGTELIRVLVPFDTQRDKVRTHCSITNNWTKYDFVQAKKFIRKYEGKLSSSSADLTQLQQFLRERRSFLLGLLENPILLEHRSFSNLLWATFHLADELIYRKNIERLPDHDTAHLMNDCARVYVLLLLEWLDYMYHLKQHYPYLFSMATRLRPFEAEEKIEVTA